MFLLLLNEDMAMLTHSPYTDTLMLNMFLLLLNEDMATLTHSPYTDTLMLNYVLASTK